MSNKPLVLIVDDEVQIRRLLELTLEQNDFRTLAAENGEEGILRARMDHPDLIVLDLGLPDLDGTQVLKRIRQESTVPIIILSVRNSEPEIIACLDDGADDYLVKPFRSGELLARVRAAIRHRHSTLQSPVFQSGTLTVDLEGRTVKKGSEMLKLTATEFKLLSLFVRFAGRVLTHRYILEEVWGAAHAEQSEYTRVYVGQLRKKIEDDPGNPKLILTESGIGYRFAVSE